MVELRIVSGRIIEQRGSIVITVQGDLVSSYDLRYYRLPETDTTGLSAESDQEESTEASFEAAAPAPVVLSDWKRRVSLYPSKRGSKKSANRA
ncbi:hypothetical protein [Saccharibacillus qingshengii]|uniref:hypothetical protein n=1 Tax=Saccharibacillus qingshengii TaxID=1763540 RepID=UPI001556899D|nr:hypothetical protein [Saccharibacillus qingshengii]